MVPTEPTPVLAQTDSTALVAAALFPAVTLLVLGTWVCLDARARASANPVAWGVAAAVVPPFLAVYVYARSERHGVRSGPERLALTLLLALLSAMIVGTVLSPPDVFAQPRNTFGGLLLTLPLFYFLVYRTEDDPETTETS